MLKIYTIQLTKLTKNTEQLKYYLAKLLYNINKKRIG